MSRRRKSRAKSSPAAPVARTLVEEPALVPKRTGAAWPRKMASPKSLAFALGALALLAMGGLGYSLFPRGAGQPPTNGGTNCNDNSPC